MTEKLTPDLLREAVNAYFFDGLPTKKLAGMAQKCAEEWRADLAELARLREKVEEEIEKRNVWRDTWSKCELGRERLRELLSKQTSYSVQLQQLVEKQRAVVRVADELAIHLYPMNPDAKGEISDHFLPAGEVGLLVALRGMLSALAALEQSANANAS